MDIRNSEQQSVSQLDSNQSIPLKMPIPQWARAFVLAALASSCATAPKPQPALDNQEVVATLKDPIECSKDLTSLHEDLSLFSDTPVCDKPVPNAANETIEFTENIRSRSGKGKNAYHVDTTIKPVNTPPDYCKTTKVDKWITPTLDQSPNQWANETLIGLSLVTTGKAKVSGDASTTLADREVQYLAEQKLYIRKILKGYRIRRTPEGVHFQTEVVECD